MPGRLCCLGQIRLRRKDGSARWISWNSRTEGDLFYGYGRDITAAKAQEQDLADAERALRRRLLEIAELSRRTYADVGWIYRPGDQSAIGGHGFRRQCRFALA